MREFGFSSLSLSGSLLIAHPSLLDPNFRKSVLFLTANDAEEGSFGLIINRPAGRAVGELLPSKLPEPLAHLPVFVGGPVGADQLIFASFEWHDQAHTMECRHHLAIEEASEAAASSTTVVRAFIGYSGWGKGQLEGELSQRSWLVQKPERDVLELDRCPLLWRQVTSTFGPWYRLAAEAPEDLTQN